jgi:sugar diacid utilization regulator
MKPNMALRFYAKGHGVALWQVAQQMGIHVNTLINRLRVPFGEKEADEFKHLVENIAEGSGQNGQV